MMKPSDAARILAVAAVYDRRTVGELDAKAWADALDDLDPAACANAVRRHYRESTAWLMPARVRELVLLMARETRRSAHDDRVFGEIEARKENFDPEASRRGAAEARKAFHAALEAKHAREAAEAERRKAQREKDDEQQEGAA